MAKVAAAGAVLTAPEAAHARLPEEQCFKGTQKMLADVRGLRGAGGFVIRLSSLVCLSWGTGEA